MTLGRIPWSKARAYAVEEYGLEGAAVGNFWRVIHAMDEGFLGDMKEQHERYTRANRPAKSRGRDNVIGARSRSRLVG